MTKRIVLIGAGSSNFGLGTLGDIVKSKSLAGSTVVLHDINPQALARVEKAANAAVAAKSLPFQIEATTDRREALQGADFCIISIEVGSRFELWNQDWHVAQQYGIRQVYGENGGPGGLFHSMRIIPPILDICADIMTICPEAWVFNFSNPMSRICTTVKRKFPALRLVGLCHEIASLPNHLPKILGTPLENIAFTAGGLNHFSVLLDVRYKDTGADAYPDVRAKAPAYFAAQPSLVEWAAHQKDPSIPLEHKGSVWSERELFKVILETFGYLPITTDSHFGEYIQWAHEVVDHQGILDFYRLYQIWCTMMISDERMSGTTEEEGWSVVPIIEAIVTGEPRHEAAVNVLNDGLIDNLPAFLAVEVPAIIDSSGVRGVPLGALPAGFAGLLQNQVAVHDLTAEAILNCSKQLALQALLVDPVVHSYKAARQTLDTMLELQPQWLGYIK
jgi:alpha-galactosidase